MSEGDVHNSTMSWCDGFDKKIGFEIGFKIGFKIGFEIGFKIRFKIGFEFGFEIGQIRKQNKHAQMLQRNKKDTKNQKGGMNTFFYFTKPDQIFT